LDVFSVVGERRGDPVLDAERRTRRLLGAVSKHGAKLICIGSFVTMARPQTDSLRLRADLIKLAHPYFQVKSLIAARMTDFGGREV